MRIAVYLHFKKTIIKINSMKKDWYSMIPFITGCVLLIFGGWLIETPMLDNVPEDVFNRWYNLGIASIAIGALSVVIGCGMLISIWNRKK